MQDSPASAPEQLVAGTFRASIQDRQIAIDFGRVRTSGNGSADVDVAHRIVIDRAMAFRLISALNTCLRDHETRWRFAPPEEAAAGPRPQTPSHAQPDAAAPKAALLFRVLDDTHAPHMYERSVRLSEGTLAANRFLLSLSRHQVKSGFEGIALDLAGRIGLPAALREAVARDAVRARAVHLGFEGDERILYKYYVEFDPAAADSDRRSDGGVILHVAYKWDTADPAQAIVSRYVLFPSLAQAQIDARLAALYGRRSEASLQIARAALEIACTRVEAESLQYLEVEEDGNDRRSFDLNYYDAGLLVKDLQAPLAQMRAHFSIKPGQFQALYDQIKPQTAGHLAGGMHRNGRDFFNVYYGVQRRQG